jgi:PAS domain S-box-containing protein
MYFPDGWKELPGQAGAGAGATDWESLVHPDDLAGCHAAFEHHINGETPLYHHEYRLRTEDGGYRWVLGRGKIMGRDADGTPLRVVGTLLDITDKKEMEHALALAVQHPHCRGMIEAVVDGIVVIDAVGIVHSLNPSAERIFGYASAEIVGRNISMLMPEPYRGSHDQYLRRYAETGEAHIIGHGREAVGLRKDGTPFPISLAVSEMRIDGKAYFTGIVRDITLRKRSEAALRIAASVYRSVDEAIVVTDADNHILTANEPFTQLSGYELHEVIGENPKILASGRHDQVFYENMWHCLKTEGIWEGEIWDRRKNGQEYLGSLSISIIYDNNGEVLRHVAVFSEIESQ